VNLCRTFGGDPTSFQENPDFGRVTERRRTSTSPNYWKETAQLAGAEEVITGEIANQQTVLWIAFSPPMPEELQCQALAKIRYIEMRTAR
jgi:hypothetical protein